jgi:hypothetical protein
MKSRSPREFSWKSSLDCAGLPTLAGNARDLSRWIMWDGAPVIKFKEHLDKPSHDARREATAGTIGTALRRSRSGRMASESPTGAQDDRWRPGCFPVTQQA